MVDQSEQLALIHIGIIIKHFVEEERLPDSLDDVASALEGYLGVVVSKGDKFTDLRDRAVKAYIDNFSIEAKTRTNSDAFDDAMKGI